MQLNIPGLADIHGSLPLSEEKGRMDGKGVEFGERDKERREEGRGNCDNDGKKLINKKMMKICCMKLSFICILFYVLKKSIARC